LGHKNDLEIQRSELTENVGETLGGKFFEYEIEGKLECLT